MIRGTTPTLEFGFPFDVGLIEKVSIVLCQYGTVIIEKTLNDCIADGQTMTVKLSQAETLKLSDRRKTDIQVRVKMVDGNALASDIFHEDTYRILKDGEI